MRRRGTRGTWSEGEAGGGKDGGEIVVACSVSVEHPRLQIDHSIDKRAAKSYAPAEVGEKAMDALLVGNFLGGDLLAHFCLLTDQQGDYLEGL